MAYYGLLLYIFFEYVRPTSFLPFLYPFHLNSVLPLSILLYSFTKSEHISNLDVFKSFNFRLALYFLFLIFLSILTSDVTLYAFNQFKTVLGYTFVIFILIKFLTNFKKLNGFMLTLIFCHVCVLLLNPQIIIDPTSRHYLSSGSFLGDGNDFAVSLNITIPFAIYLFIISQNKAIKLLYIVFLCVMILAIIGTSSRGGSLALVSVLFYYWLKSRKKFIGSFILAIVVLMGFLFAPQIYFDRMKTLQNYTSDGSAMGRILAWKAAIRMATDNPILGVGAGHFPVKFGVEYRPKGYGANEIPWLTAHSQYFLALGELGIPGLLFLLLFIFYNLRNNKKLIIQLQNDKPPNYKSSITLLYSLNASIFGYSIGGAFLSILYYPHLFVLAGINETVKVLISRIKDTSLKSVSELNQLPNNK